MSPEHQDFPIWIRNTMRTLALAGLIFVGWTAYSIYNDAQVLDALARRSVTYQSGQIGDSYWLAFGEPLPAGVTFTVSVSGVADDGETYAWRTFVTTSEDSLRRYWIGPPNQLGNMLTEADIRTVAYRNGRSRILPPATIQFNTGEVLTAMTWEQVRDCYLSNFPAPSNPNGIVPAWVGAFSLDGLPPPPFPTFSTDQEAYEWIAANWTAKDPCS